MPKRSSTVSWFGFSRSIWIWMYDLYSGLANSLARYVPSITTTTIDRATFHRL